jgi:hypothetical protein
MKKYFINLLFILIIFISNLFSQHVKSIDGNLFEAESRQTSPSGKCGSLRGLFSYGSAVYKFHLPSTADRIKAIALYKKLGNKPLKIYIYNYGTATDDPAVRNRKLNPNWRLWETTDADGRWDSRNPGYLYTTSYDGRIDYLGPKNIFQVMLYTEGSVPYLSEGRYLIENVQVQFSMTDSIISRIVTSDNVWIEGNFLLAKGIGKGRSRIDFPGYDVIPKKHAQRAAKIEAQKNLAIALKMITNKGGTAFIPPANVRSTRFIDDMTVEVILEIPLASLHETGTAEPE